MRACRSADDLRGDLGLDMEHVTVFREVGRYAGWPANYGIWSWGDEIVVGFALGYLRKTGTFHACDRDRPIVAMQARSRDGGLSWTSGRTPCRVPGGLGLSADEHQRPDLTLAASLNKGGFSFARPKKHDVLDPGFALMCARTGLTAGARSWFYTSTDRCKSWDGPYELPSFGQTGVAARTDYVVSGAGGLLLFLTAAKADGEEGRAFCARSTDSGKTFALASFVGPEPDGFAIMPASVRLSGTRLLAAVRCRGRQAIGAPQQNWVDLFVSDDDGSSWALLSRPVSNTGDGGNPPSLTLLRDGRLCLTYGFRDPPFGIRAVLSPDGGTTWGQEIALRDDGGSHDVGYPRTVQRPDGSLVTAYYFNDHPDGERYIAATVWRP